MWIYIHLLYFSNSCIILHGTSPRWWAFQLFVTRMNSAMNILTDVYLGLSLLLLNILQQFPFSQLLPNSDLPLFPAQFQNLLYLPTVIELNILISLWSPRASLFVWLYVLLSHYSYGIHQPNWNTAFLVFSHICNFLPSLCSYYSTSWMHCLHLQL